MEFVREVFGENTKIVAPKQNNEKKKPEEPEIIKDIENIFGIVDKKIVDNNVHQQIVDRLNAIGKFDVDEIGEIL